MLKIRIVAGVRRSGHRKFSREMEYGRYKGQLFLNIGEHLMQPARVMETLIIFFRYQLQFRTFFCKNETKNPIKITETSPESKICRFIFHQVFF